MRFTVRHAALPSVCSDECFGLTDTDVEPQFDNEKISRIIGKLWYLPPKNSSPSLIFEQQESIGVYHGALKGQDVDKRIFLHFHTPFR